MPLPLRPCRKTIDAFRDFYDALLALTPLAARSGNWYAQVLGAIEERGALRRLHRLPVDGERHHFRCDPTNPSTSPRGAETDLDRKKRWRRTRSEEHTSELQSLRHLVCRLL